MTSVFAGTGSPFANAAMRLWQQGYSVLPLLPASEELATGPLPQPSKSWGKAPADYTFGRWHLRRSWNDYRVRTPSEYEIQHWITYPGANIGLILGNIGQIIALDFDWDIDGLHAQLLDMLPTSPCRKVGAKGFTGFYRYNGEKSESWSRAGKTVLELLSDGRQTVIPPSVHPETLKPYEWHGQPLMDTPIEDLPFLPDGFIEAARELIDVHDDEPFTLGRQKREPIADIREWLDGRFAFKSPTPEKVLEALHFIHPDDGHNLWIEMGMALKVEFGDDGFQIWDTWSSWGAKYNDPHNSGRMKTAWKSFKGSAKTIASVFYEAQRRGFINIGEIEGLDKPVSFAVVAGGNLECLSNGVADPEYQPTTKNTQTIKTTKTISTTALEPHYMTLKNHQISEHKLPTKIN